MKYTPTNSVMHINMESNADQYYVFLNSIPTQHKNHSMSDQFMKALRTSIKLSTNPEQELNQ